MAEGRTSLAMKGRRGARLEGVTGKLMARGV